ncbi:MAG TPA: Uma2 family endonuclease [Verrucomicrobiae bacterium]|jgi:Uma2 family endonuclease
MHSTTISGSRNGTARNKARQPGVPQLLNGDHLNVPEFEQRYEIFDEDRRAELIEGIVVMSPPISSDHGKANISLAWLLSQYAVGTPRTAAAVNTSIRLDGTNEYQPDVMVWIETGAMTRVQKSANGILEGRPELVVEIALSSRSYDLNEKKAVYQRNQVPEYLIWVVMDSRIQWLVLEEGGYVPLKGRADGTHCSRIFPGLWLNFLALVSGDGRKAIRILDNGLKSAAHKTFVKQLAKS